MSKSIAEGTVPQSWKKSHVIPIYKKGPKSDCGNYRPISLTSMICKILESIIRDHITEHIVQNSLLSSCQHGFVRGRSCSTQLLKCLDIWIHLLDEGTSIYVIYLDFAKAFDSVSHKRLLNKLKAYGVTNKLCKWSAEFLMGRKQKVIVNGVDSTWQDVLSGVPQGSVLGPLYFIIFINDLPDIVHNFIALFADDAKLFSAIQNVEDRRHLHHDLVQLHEWASRWQLKFNAKKCKVMHLGRLNRGHIYTMDEVELEETTEEKDLGVTIDYELKFDIHIEGQVNKANSKLGLIRRSFDALDAETFVMLYKTLVRPHLEYCNAITYPLYERQAKLLEGVQRRATKLIPNLKEMNYNERLKVLKLPSLQYRRVRGDIIEAYKYLHKIYDVSPCPLTLDDNPVSTRGNSLKLKKTRCNKSVTQKFFTHRVVDPWNGLPDHVVLAPTLNTLKNRLQARSQPARWGGG